MNSWFSIDIILFSSGMLSTLILTPIFRRIAAATGFMDVPAANHKGHRKATPLLGGAAIFCGWFACLAGGYLAVKFELSPSINTCIGEYINGIYSTGRQLVAIVGAGALAVLLGLWDDKWAMSAKWKFLGQFVVALVAVFMGGVRVNVFIEHPAITTAISVFWLMLLMNSINFFDNMDGLAVGTIALAMGFFACFAILNQQFFVAAFAAMTCGCACGFWVYNAAPASIFMGDSGSHFLGYLAAVISARVTYFNTGSGQSQLAVLIPLFILALPLFDTAMVVIIRTVNKKPFWIGDHNHISHRFVRMGMSRPRAVLLVHLLALCVGLGMLPVFWGDRKTAAVIVIQSVMLLGIVTILQLALSERPDARE